jgi:APA family basic amino acid/polyamine antiporter
MRAKRLLGVPFLYSAASAAVGFSIYFSIGVVADRGLGLTPLIFLAAGLMFALTSLSYVEGGAMLRERGGSATFARHAFNELISFIAGWAILIDYLIVIAAAAVSTAHYLTPISGSFSGGLAETTIAVGVIAIAVIFNIANFTGRAHQMGLLVLAFADLALQVAVIAVGAAVVFDPSLLTAQLDLFTSPSGRDVVYAAAVATIAFAGIEAASDLAPDLEFKPQDLRRASRATSTSWRPTARSPAGLGSSSAPTRRPTSPSSAPGRSPPGWPPPGISASWPASTPSDRCSRSPSPTSRSSGFG